MDWDLAQLRAFAAAVDAGSLELAAQRLHLTPSAVSQRLKALERSVGTVLLQRSRPVRATEAGARVLRLARELELLTRDAAAELGADDEAPVLRIAVNADSLVTWALPALVEVSEVAGIQLVREDQDVTADLLRSGDVVGAVTSEASAVQGCTVERLGTMTYRPRAAPTFAGRWFPHGLTAAALGSAPVVVFDEHDTLQHQVLERYGAFARRVHVVPASDGFNEAVRLGLGWGMVPDLQVPGWTEADAVVLGDARDHVDVPLYWQQWALRTPTLDAVASALRRAARTSLAP
ncbi:LysR family transcriptional regulator ArgP [Tessaracoccus palaemonis]|uniref:LysR family transcriptional regulator ArgP n=1 Tax=Tessaracoccus palaemonis TaxID=2829499 RepID=A0ABX8SIF3_9ACTN|nr:LysR family transcriptional regulator ArgP [Tessaracoccus palaemonis]QXT63068.1 LysR family transcriptional regulator ArgP [Tessaracoccus palaemonis]